MTLHLENLAALFLLLLLSVSMLLIWWRGRRAREEARRHADLVETILRDPREGLCALDLEGRITFVNETAERMLGWTRAELLGRDFHEVVHGVRQGQCSAGAMDCSLQASLRPGRRVHSGHGEMETKNGDIVHMALTVRSLLRAGKVRGVMVAFRDLSEDVRAAELPGETEVRYRSVVEASPDGIILADPYGFISMANGTAARMFGYADSRDMLGMRFVELVAPEDRPRQQQTASTS